MNDIVDETLEIQITNCEKITGVSYRHLWSVDVEMYLKKAKASADAYYKSPRHVLHGMSFPWMSDVL